MLLKLAACCTRQCAAATGAIPCGGTSSMSHGDNKPLLFALQRPIHRCPPNLASLSNLRGPHALTLHGARWRNLPGPHPPNHTSCISARKPLGDLEAGVVANYTVNPAKWAEGSDIIVCPIYNLIRVKNCLTIKANVLSDFCTVINGLFVSNTERMAFGQIEHACHIDRLPCEGR
jgi:hypothetical protein